VRSRISDSFRARINDSTSSSARKFRAGKMCFSFASKMSSESSSPYSAPAHTGISEIKSPLRFLPIFVLHSLQTSTPGWLQRRQLEGNRSCEIAPIAEILQRFKCHPHQMLRKMWKVQSWGLLGSAHLVTGFQVQAESLQRSSLPCLERPMP